MYVDPDYEQTHLVGERWVRSYDPVRHAYVWCKAYRMQAGITPQPRNGDEQLAPERLSERKSNADSWNRKRRERNVAAITKALREHGALTRRQLAEYTGLVPETCAKLCRQEEDIHRLGIGENNEAYYGLAGHQPPPSELARAIHATLCEHGPLPVRHLAQRMERDRGQVYNLLHKYRGQLFAMGGEGRGVTWWAV